MAVDMFLKLNGIKGESQDHKHKDEIAIDSFSWGASNGSTIGRGSGGGAGKGVFQSLSVSKRVDKSSTDLLLHCISGKHIPDGVLTVREAGGESPVEYLVVKLNDIMVTSATQGASAMGDIVNESLSLEFGKVVVEYKPQSAKGTGEGALTFGWNVATNKQV